MTNSQPQRDYTADRERMLSLLRRHVTDQGVLDALRDVPRECFVPPELKARAYDDRALPLSSGQTISQPLIVALMTDALELRPTDRVLELGTGSGYQAAVLSMLVREVITLERVDELRESAQRVLADLGYGNVHVHPAGEKLGRAEDAPYDAIIVTAAAPHVPRILLRQLTDGGRMLIPVGTRQSQELLRVRNTEHGVTLERLGPCAFVPLIGPDAWPDGVLREGSKVR